MSLDAARKRLEKAEKNSAAALVELHQAKRAFDEAFAAKFGQGESPASKATPKAPSKTPVAPAKAKGQMSDADLRDKIIELNKEKPALTDKKKAKRLGVSTHRVYQVRKKYGIKGLRGPELDGVKSDPQVALAKKPKKAALKGKSGKTKLAPPPEVGPVTNTQEIIPAEPTPEVWDVMTHLGGEVDLPGGRKGRSILGSVPEHALSQLQLKHQIEEVVSGNDRQWVYITRS
jgi:ribosomal protein L29